MNTDFTDKMEAAYPKFSKGQRAIAGYIKEHFDKAAFMTASALGSIVGVSESTVVRFAMEIGYEGYPQLQKALREIVRSRLTSVQRIEVTNARLRGEDVLEKVLRMDIDAIRRTTEESERNIFRDAVARIVKAKRIYIMGVGSAAPLAGFMSYYFTHIFDDVRNVEVGSTSSVFEQMLRIGPGDVFIGITFPRYSKRTIEAASFAKANGAGVIALTDSLSTSISQTADCALVAKSDIASFVDSLVAPLSLINALIVAISLEKKDETAEIYAKLEGIWDEYNVYEKNNDGHSDDGASI